jgi:hypothetical protein
MELRTLRCKMALAFLAGLVCVFAAWGCAGGRGTTTAANAPVDWSQVLIVRGGMVLKSGRTHYYNMRTWEPIENPEFFISTSGFIEGLCPARREPEGKMGYIDRTGHVVIPFRYDKAFSFDHGRASVYIGEQKGVIDTSGRWVVEPGTYERLVGYEEGRCAYLLPKREGEAKAYWGFLDLSGKHLWIGEYQRVRTRPLEFREGRCLAKTRLGDVVYVDYRGRARVRLANPKWNAWHFSEGLARVDMHVDLRTEEEKERFYEPGITTGWPLPQFGFIDKEGRVIIKPQFTSAGDFTEGLAPASTTDEGRISSSLGEYFPDDFQMAFERRWGFINKQGEWVIPMIYEQVRHFHDGLAPFRKNGKWGYLNRQGKEVVSPQFDEAWEFSRGVAKVVIDGEVAVIDASGRIVLRTGLQFAPIDATILDSWSSGGGHPGDR